MEPIILTPEQLQVIVSQLTAVMVVASFLCAFAWYAARSIVSALGEGVRYVVSYRREKIAREQTAQPETTRYAWTDEELTDARR